MLGEKVFKQLYCLAPHESIFNQNLNLPTTPSDAKIAKAEMGKILGKIVKTTLLVEFLRY